VLAATLKLVLQRAGVFNVRLFRLTGRKLMRYYEERSPAAPVSAV